MLCFRHSDFGPFCFLKHPKETTDFSPCHFQTGALTHTCKKITSLHIHTLVLFSHCVEIPFGCSFSSSPAGVSVGTMYRSPQRFQMKRRGKFNLNLRPLPAITGRKDADSPEQSLQVNEHSEGSYFSVQITHRKPNHVVKITHKTCKENTN